jgi:hypothetical protein
MCRCEYLFWNAYFIFFGKVILTFCYFTSFHFFLIYDVLKNNRSFFILGRDNYFFFLYCQAYQYPLVARHGQFCIGETLDNFDRQLILPLSQNQPCKNFFNSNKIINYLYWNFFNFLLRATVSSYFQSTRRFNSFQIVQNKRSSGRMSCQR